MALRDRIKSVPADADRDVEKTYVETPLDDRTRAQNIAKAKKRRRRLLIGLGIAAAITTLMFPFAIAIAATATGATGVALGGTAVLLGGAAIGCDVGLVGAWALTRPGRRKGKTAKRIEQQNPDAMKHFEKSETADLMAALYARANKKDLAKKEKMVAEETKKLISFENVDEAVVAAFLSGPLTKDETRLLKQAEKKYPGLIAKFNAKDPSKFTDDEKKEIARVQGLKTFKDLGLPDMVKRIEDHRKLTVEEYKALRAGARPNDEAVRAKYGPATINYDKPYVYEEIVVTDKTGKTSSIALNGVKTRTKQGHEIFELQVSLLTKEIGDAAELLTYNPETTIKNRYQKAALDDKKAQDAARSIAVAEVGAFTK